MRRWYCNAMRESRSPPPFNEEPQISKDFWGFLVFLPADLFLLRCFFFSLNISLSRRFRRWRRFFLIDYFSPTDFTDLHRFSSFFCHFFISQILDLSVWEDDADFCSHELEKDYADFSNSLFFLLSIHWFLYIINLLIRHFSDPYFFTSFVLFPCFLTSFFL